MRNDPILMHYGVKGMKWRHRKGGVGAAEGISNNPNAGNTSTSTYTDRQKSKVKNVYKSRLEQLQERYKVGKTTEHVSKGAEELKKELRRREVKKGLDMGVAKGLSAEKSAKEKSSKNNPYMKGLKSGLKPDYNPNKKSVRDSENNKSLLKKKKGKL